MQIGLGDSFIADSFSCRINKGTHKAISRFCNFSRKVSKNNTKTCWILKCDIKKFFASIDQFMKHKLKVKYYIRYADDFVIFSDNKDWLEKLTSQIQEFLQNKLKLELHPNKVFIKTLVSGVDFLGWINFADYRILRTTTKRRMLKRIKENPKSETINSYLGLLKHGDTQKIKKLILGSN